MHSKIAHIHPECTVYLQKELDYAVIKTLSTISPTDFIFRKGYLVGSFDIQH